MKIAPGIRDITVYVSFRSFKDDWIEKNETVLNGIKWQNVDGLKVKFVCWPDEVETIEYAGKNGYECVVVPWYRHYLFPGPLKSFKNMFETILLDCDTEIFVYINGDIVLGPGILKWIQENIEMNTLYSLPRHNWEFTNKLESPEDFKDALEKAVPEEWTAIDLFAFRSTDGRKDLIPFPPFLLTAGSMDSYIVVKTGALGWKRVLIPPEDFHMLHIEHEYSHPLKPGASPEKAIKWAFNCGVYAAATQGFDINLLSDTSLECFKGAERYKFKFGYTPKTNYNSPKKLFFKLRGENEK